MRDGHLDHHVQEKDGEGGGDWHGVTVDEADVEPSHDRKKQKKEPATLLVIGVMIRKQYSPGPSLSCSLSRSPFPSVAVHRLTALDHCGAPRQFS